VLHAKSKSRQLLVKGKIHSVFEFVGRKEVFSNSKTVGNKLLLFTATRPFPKERRDGNGSSRQLLIEVESQRSKREYHSVPNGKKSPVVFLELLSRMRWRYGSLVY
jgi:hypothetical protein